jgi:hypothetical protein
LEEVMISTIDQHDIGMAYRFGSREASKPASDNDDPLARHCVHCMAGYV